MIQDATDAVLSHSQHPLLFLFHHFALEFYFFLRTEKKGVSTIWFRLIFPLLSEVASKLTPGNLNFWPTVAFPDKY